MSDPYQQLVPGWESSGAHAALDGQGGRRGPDGPWISQEHDSYAALAEAMSMDDRSMLLVGRLESKDWH